MKKEIWKKWWFWVVAVFLVAAFVTALTEVDFSGERAQEVAETDEENEATEEDESEGEEESDTDTLIEDELTPLVNSVSSNVDTNWKLYFEEPVQRLANDGDMEAFRSDLGLLVDLFNGIVADIDELEAPEDLSPDEAEAVNQIKEGLKGAVTKRIEAADSLIEMADVQEILDTDVVSMIEESNEHLSSAVKAYESLIN